MIRKYKGKIVAVLLAVAAAPLAHATDPESLEGFATNAATNIGAGKTVALLAAGLSMGWVAFRIIKKYTSKA